MKISSLQIISFFLMCLPTMLVWAQETDFPRTVFTQIAEENAPKIDGVIDDEVWVSIEPISDFRQTEPNDGAEPTQRTEVKLAYSKSHIYAAFKAFDSDIENVVAKELIQGQRVYSDDRVGIQLDTFNDRRNAYYFVLNPNGIRTEALSGNDYYIDDWTTVWFGETKIHDWGWSAEIAIPVKGISFDSNTSIWGLNLFRGYPKNDELSVWSSANRTARPSVSGFAEGIYDLDQGLGVEFSPSLSLGVVKDGDGKTDNIFEPSLTTFYNLNSNLTAGLTLNTDFSGTDVDARQVNLNRFSLFFPEKRDFFLRDASIFEFGGIGQNARPFFSRRIGLSDSGDRLDLDAGLKLSGRLGDWNVGALAVQQDTLSSLADDKLFVARATRNVFDESEIGIITTQGDPNADSDNSLWGLDYTYRSNTFLDGKSLRSNVWYQKSDSNGVDDKQSAYGVRLEYPNYQYDGYIDYRRIEENFNPALGFVNRAGVDQVEGKFRYRHELEHSERLQWLGASVDVKRTDRIDGGVQSEESVLNFFEGTTRHGDIFSLFATREKEGVIVPFDLSGRVPIAPGLYEGYRWGFYFNTSKHRTVQAEMVFSDGDFFGGQRRRLQPSIAWKPNKHLSFSLNVSNNKLELPGDNFTSQLYGFKANIAFNSRWAWLNFIQGDNVSDTVSLNSRLRYQPRPGREFLLVFDHAHDTENSESLGSALLLKVSVNYQL